MKVYTIFDRISGLYQFPFPAENDGCAIRYFREVCAKSYFGQDLELYAVGTFEKESGIMQAQKPDFLIKYEVSGNG